MLRRLAAGVAGALLAAAAPASAQTNGYLLPCSSAGSLGSGCTTLTNSGDPAALLANPAGLTALDGRVLSLSGAAFLPTMSYRNAVNTLTDGKNNVFPLPAVFYAYRPGNRWAVGVGIQTLGGMGADYTLTNPILGHDQRYHSKFGLMKGGLSVAFAPLPELSVGVMAGALYGQLEMATPYAVNPAQLGGLAALGQDPAYAAMLSRFNEAVAYASISGLSATAFSAGASMEYRPVRELTLGLMWTAPVTLVMGGGTATMDMNAQFTQLYQSMVAAKGGNAGVVAAQLSGFGINSANGMVTSFNAKAHVGVPQTATVAAGWRPTDDLRFGADVGWIGWAHAFKDMPLYLSHGTNANVNILMNGSASNGSFATAWPLNWTDAWTGRAGASYQATRALSLSVGGSYGNNPVPGSTLFTVFPAIVEGAATVGAGYRFGDTQLDVAFAHTFSNSQTANTKHLVATEYAGATSTLAENTISLGLRWRF